MHGRDDDFIPSDHTDAVARAYGGRDLRVHKPKGNHNAKRPYDCFVLVVKFLAQHLLGDEKAPRRVDFLEVYGIPPHVENPYLFPPWAFVTAGPGVLELASVLSARVEDRPRASRRK